MARFFSNASSTCLLRVLALTAALAATGCSQPTTLQSVKDEGVLHVITRVAPSIYYEGRDAATGYDYELARRFADELGVELRVRVAEDNSEVLSVLAKDYAHIGLAGLTQRPDFEGKFRVVPIGVQAQSVVVYHRDYPSPSSLSDLNGETLHLLADSNHEHVIASRPEGAAIKRQVHSGLDAAGLLARVETGEIAYAAVSSNELDLNHVYFPMVKEGFALDEPRELIWLFPAAQDDSLANAAAEFLSQARDNGSMAQLAERFYGHLDRLNYVGARTFMHHVENRLPKYKSLFKGYASEVELDWRLLAAIGYQESHWRPNAVSPTGVRGLMMLTRNTASYIGINNRLDPEESIEGGARYFRMVHAKIPERIPEPDRTWFALASYNVGFGHLEDARRLTQSGGKDPDRWMDVKEFLPLLAQKEWYTKTRFGYARGHEPVVYVQNIRRYYDVLTRITEPDQPATAPNPELVSLHKGAEPAADNDPANDLGQDLRAALPSELHLIPPTL
ncbi:membrane-bound lytic murein transglycosylase MltF [Marinobacter halophilus]|uniref:membrane-bound lytic murein transglycosylase MltF n=1 Tax=Marinobacter halophilus TaxID=1323740 RepID=UPI0019A0080D|nr:membrane-bound lytic murein transglycosylase MltF [Marinobacter halophilus]GGC55805.1 membrane-bound lytic murein transglycosylase F [Marinobacter halophilus]